MRPVTKCLGLSCLLGAFAFGCQKEQDQPAAPAASVEKPSTIDPALAKAVAAASVGVGTRAAPAGSGGPPPGGIFAPGEADRQVPKGAAPKLTLGGNGSEPRVKLGPMQPKPGWKAAGAVQISVQGDQRPPLPIDLGVTLEAQKPKSADADAPAPAGVPVVAKITSARAGVTGIPAEYASVIDKLKGSKVEYQVMPDGSASGYTTSLAPGAEDLRDRVRSLSEVLALVTLPVPSEPVGKGAYWMVTSREGVFGLDLVTYRMVKVEQASEFAATLSISTKRYATSTSFDFDGLPPDAPRKLAEFEAKSEGRLELRAGSPFPESGEIQSVLGASLDMGNQQRGMLQVQSRVGLDFRAPTR